jgi:HEPN domain.
LQREGVEVPEELHEAVDLTEFAWETRYPGTGEPATEAEYRRAAALAERVVHWAESQVEGKAP